MDDNVSSISSNSIDINDEYYTTINNDNTIIDHNIYKDIEETSDKSISKSIDSSDNINENIITDERIDIFTQLQSELIKLENLQDAFQKIYLKILFKGASTNRLKPEHVTLYKLLCELNNRKNDRNGLQRVYSPIRSNNHYYQMIRNLSQVYRFSDFLKLVFMLFILNVPVEVLYFALVSYCGYCATLSLSLHRFISVIFKLIYARFKRFIPIIKIFIDRIRSRVGRDGGMVREESVENNQNDSIQESVDNREVVENNNENTYPDEMSNNNDQVRDLMNVVHETSQIRNRNQVVIENIDNRVQPRQMRDRNYVEKFCYQLFFSFFMSLIPWWTPNPEYL